MDGNKQALEILGEVKKAVVGKDDVLAKVLLAILARGHILLEDIPGVGKTTLALAFSREMPGIWASASGSRSIMTRV